MDLVVERHLLGPRVVGDPGRIHESDEHVTRLEAEVGCLQFHERTHEQAAARQQHQRERDLGDDESLPQAAPARLRTVASAALERLGQLRAPDLQRRREAEEEAGRERDQRREDQHRRIEADLRDARRAGGRDRDQRFDGPETDEQAAQPAQPGDQRAFGQQLAHQASAAGAECDPDGEFAAA